MCAVSIYANPRKHIFAFDRAALTGSRVPRIFHLAIGAVRPHICISREAIFCEKKAIRQRRNTGQKRYSDFPLSRGQCVLLPYRDVSWTDRGTNLLRSVETIPPFTHLCRVERRRGNSHRHTAVRAHFQTRYTTHLVNKSAGVIGITFYCMLFLKNCQSSNYRQKPENRTYYSS